MVNESGDKEDKEVIWSWSVTRSLEVVWRTRQGGGHRHNPITPRVRSCHDVNFVCITMTTSIPPTSHKKQKRKHHATDPDHDSPTKKKKERRREKGTPKRHPKSKQDKGKSRVDSSTSEFLVTKATIKLSVPPVFSSNLRAGAEEMLDSMIMRCE
jgi:hypothetical protein